MDACYQEKTAQTQKKLTTSFYCRSDVVAIGKDLLGKFLFTQIDGALTGGMIIETESYGGVDDKACHAYKGRRTKRTDVMFWTGGVAYVYLCYGIHHLFNIVTHEQGTPHAVLIRAIQPTTGIDRILQRRKKLTLNNSTTTGPGTITQALGITTHHSGKSLLGNTIWIEDRGVAVTPSQITASPRIGVDYAEEDALRPWRFQLLLS
ncbi:MAG: DNA-3-methyladenine glycosylase [Chlamydiota bacterium]